jgi:hypothetical protein
VFFTFGKHGREATQIKMTVYEPLVLNGTGADEILVEVTSAVPIFIPFLLFFVFGVIFITGYRKQSAATGRGDAAVWATVAGIGASVVALLLSIRPGLIDMLTLTITIVTTIFFGIWMLASR